jgi:pimeloyl-ACP methyl ester carboxylesterase
MNRPAKITLTVLVLLLSACVSVSRKPDLGKLYGNSLENGEPHPIIIIPGLMGSSLSVPDGREVWPGSISDLAFSDYQILTDPDLDLKPKRVIDGFAGVDFYGALAETLEQAAGYRLAVPGQPQDRRDMRRYYLFAYDWRKSNVLAVGQLHRLIEQVRGDFGDPAMKVDIIAHSNGGLIARYYLQYGPTDTSVPDWQPQPWQQGPAHVRRLAMLGTPNLGSVISVLRLYEGYKMGLRTIPVQVMTQFATPYETMPIPRSRMIIDGNGTPQDIDLYALQSWQGNQWSVFSPTFRKLLESELGDPAAAAQRAGALQRAFAEHLETARKLQTALSVPLAVTETEIALFGGDCHETRNRLLAGRRNGLIELHGDESGLAEKSPNVDYTHLLYAPGDGLVTRASQVAKAQDAYAQQGNASDLFKAEQTVFLCERHSLLTANPFFQNNLLYFLLR